jgi:protein phosphatase
MVADMQMVIYGGAASGSQSLLKDELYLLDLKNQPVWRIIDVIPKNNTPGQRYGHVMVFNKPHLIIFAGNSGNKVENDVWILNIQKGPFSWLKY